MIWMNGESEAFFYTLTVYFLREGGSGLPGPPTSDHPQAQRYLLSFALTVMCLLY
jgi:hypothetical protein